MSFYVTLFMRPDTDVSVTRHTYIDESRAIVAVEAGGLTIQPNCWEDMQRLVVVLHDGMAQARHAKDDPAAVAESR